VADFSHPQLKHKLMRKPFAAFCTAAGKHFAAVAVEHALAEAMLLLAVPLFGLEGTFHI